MSPNVLYLSKSIKCLTNHLPRNKSRLPIKIAHLLYDFEYLFGLESQENDFLNPLDIYNLTIGNEICSGNFLAVKWAKTNNLIKSSITDKVEFDEPLDCLCKRLYIVDKIDIQYIAASGNIECLKYLHEEGYPWNWITCCLVAANGHLDCLRYIHEEGCPWNKHTCWMAARNGHLDCLIYLHENGCPWDEETTQKSALNGHLDCLRYAHERGCPWNEYTCESAAYNGHLDCLIYLHENGCPWDEETCRVAVYKGHLDCRRRN